MFNSRVSANNWKMFYATYQGRDHSTKHLAAIHRMMCIAKEEDFMILSLAQNKKELQVFHQPTALGGSLDDPADHYVALLGMGPTANPVEIYAISVQDIEILMLTWVHWGRIFLK